MSSRGVAHVAAFVGEGAFEARQAFPLGWEGSAAGAFAARIEAVALDLQGLSADLLATARLIQAHEERMRALQAAMGSDS